MVNFIIIAKEIQFNHDIMTMWTRYARLFLWLLCCQTGSYTGCFFGNYKSASIIYRHQRNMLLEKVQRCGEQQVVSLWWSPSATMVCSPWHRESAWDVVEGRGGGVALRARCELNDVASRGGDSEKPWWAEHARELRCECDRCIVRWVRGWIVFFKVRREGSVVCFQGKIGCLLWEKCHILLYIEKISQSLTSHF